MSTPPPFAPNPLNFGIVAPSSQTAVTISSAPLAAATAVTASIKSSALTGSPFVIKSVGPPPPANPVTVTGSHVSSTGTGAVGVSQPVQHVPGIAGGGVSGGGGVTPGLQQVGGSGVAGQDLDVVVEFAAPANGSATSFTATLQISGEGWDSPVSVPLQAQVGTLSIACPPISVTQARNNSVTVTVTNNGPATAATISLDQKLWPSGVTVSLEPTSFNLAAGEKKPVTLKVSADISAKPSVSEQNLYWAAFANMTSYINVKLTVEKLTLRSSPIPAKYKSLPQSLQTTFGKSLGDEAFCGDYVGQYHAYEHGVIYWDGVGNTAFEVHGAVLTRYLHSGNPEVGAPPGFPSAQPTLGDYEVAPFSGFGYPITDTITSKSGAQESRFQHDYGIYAYNLGTFAVSPETFYRSNGGSTGSLGLPIADAVGSTAGGVVSLGDAPTWFGYQDFENGGVFTAGGKSEAILFGKPPGSGGTKFPLPAPGGQTLTGTVYTQPTSSQPASAKLPVPLWVLVNFAPDQMNTLVSNSVQGAVAAYNKTAAHPVNMVGDAGLQNPSVTAYTTIGATTPIREYSCGFVIHAAGCPFFGADLVSANGDIAFDLYLSLSGVTVHAGPGQTVAAMPVNPTVNWVQEGAGNLPQSARDEGAKAIVAAISKTNLNVPVPSSQTVKVGAGITADVDLYFVSTKVLTDGTLSLLAAISPESVTLG